MLDFSDKEWRQFTTTEQKIILLVRQHKVPDHQTIRELLNFPLPEPFNAKTYASIWSRLKKKITLMNKDRMLASTHANDGTPRQRSTGNES